MRSDDRRQKRSRSIDSESEDEGKRLRQRTSRRRSSGDSETKLPSTSLLTLSLLTILGARNLLPSVSDLTEMDAYKGNMDFPTGYKARPQRLRYRDDFSMVRHSIMKSGHEWDPYVIDTEPVMMMPVAVADRGRVNPHLARSVLSPTTSAHSSQQQDPSLEDIDLIDVLWRSDIAAEKGQSQYTPSDQYEHDLQLLTEKSIREPLTTSESARYEDLAKGYFEDFFFPVSCKSGNLDEDIRHREVSTPTDEDLDALLEDVTKEGGQLDQLCPNGLLEPAGPLLNNVSLSQGIIFDANNATYDMSSACATSLGESELFNNGTMDSPSWPAVNNLGPSDIFPTGPQDSVFPMFPQNDTSVPIISTGVHFNHSYTSSSVSPNSYGSPYYVPNALNSYNNESSVCSSSTTSRSPTYMSDAENMPPVSRYYGKLAPTPTDYHAQSQEDAKELKEETDTSAVPRRRGRQSKDEQLAKMNNLPMTAKEIAEMSLADLQKMLKSENLSDTQKALIKKIRRRGKNKVAARTCRQRRGDKMTKSSQEQWMDPSQLSLDA